MKNLTATLLPCVLAFAAVARAADSATDGLPKTVDTLLLANKDELHGTFLGCDSQGVHWQSPGIKEPSIFQTASLFEMTFDPDRPLVGMVPPAQSVLLS